MIKLHIIYLKQHSFNDYQYSHLVNTYTHNITIFPGQHCILLKQFTASGCLIGILLSHLPFNITFHTVLCFLMPQKRNGRWQLTHPFGRVSLGYAFLCTSVHQYAPCVYGYGCMSQKLWYLQPGNL